MKEERKSAEKTGSPRSGRPFLQPLAVALVCLILVSLLFIMGLMNLKALDRTLLGYLDGRGRNILRDVQQVARLYYIELTQIDPSFFDPVTGTPRPEDTFSLQEAFLRDVINWAQGIDIERTTGALPEDQVIQLLKNEGLWLIAFLDEKGHITFESRPVPQEILTFMSPVIQGTEAFKTNIFDRSGTEERLGLISLRRGSGKGTLILALNDAGFKYRCSRFSLRRAIDEVTADPDIVYLTMIDRRVSLSGPPGSLGEDLNQGNRREDLLQNGSEVLTKGVLSKNQNVLEFVALIRIDSDLKEAVRLGLAAEIEGRLLLKTRGSIFIAMGFMVFITLLAMWLLYKNQNRHLARMQEVERRLHQAERLSALGRLAAGIAHEIRNPLNAISMAIQRLQRDTPHQLILVIRDEIKRLNHIIEEFLSISRTSKAPLKRYDLKAFLRPITLLIEEEATSKGIKIETDLQDAHLMVTMDPNKMKQALFNIIKNAMESISEGGTIRLTTTGRGKARVSIIIADTGKGISSEEINKIFDLDYTTKDKGLGLGLPIAHEIIRGCGGEIRVSSRRDEGTTFEIILPIDNP